MKFKAFENSRTKVMCNNCNWEGEERDLEVNQDTLEDKCPSCGQEDEIKEI